MVYLPQQVFMQLITLLFIQKIMWNNINVFDKCFVWQIQSDFFSFSMFYLVGLSTFVTNFVNVVDLLISHDSLFSSICWLIWKIKRNFFLSHSIWKLVMPNICHASNRTIGNIFSCLFHHYNEPLMSLMSTCHHQNDNSSWFIHFFIGSWPSLVISNISKLDLASISLGIDWKTFGVSKNIICSYFINILLTLGIRIFDHVLEHWKCPTDGQCTNTQLQVFVMRILHKTHVMNIFRFIFVQER